MILVHVKDLESQKAQSPWQQEFLSGAGSGMFELTNQSRLDIQHMSPTITYSDM